MSAIKIDCGKLSPAAICTIICVLFIMIANIFFPNSFLLFAFNTFSSLPLAFTLLWSALIVLLIVIASTSNKLSNSNYLLSAIIIMIIFTTSFFAFRTQYPSLLADAEPGARPVTPEITWDQFPGAGSGRVQDLINVAIANYLPISFSFKYRHTLIFDNFPINNAAIIQAIFFGILTVATAIFVIKRSKIDANKKTALLIFLLCSTPMLNAYGQFRSFSTAIFFCGLWFLALLRLNDKPRDWKSHLIIISATLMAAWNHPFYATTTAYVLALIAFIICSKVLPKAIIPLTITGGLFIAFAPALYTFVSPYYKEAVLSSIHTGTMSCMDLCFPALILFITICITSWRKLLTPNPLQATCIMIIISQITLFYSSNYEYAIVMNLALSLGATLIYLAIAYLYLSLKLNHKHLLFAAILGAYMFIPSVYIHSNHHIADRLMVMCPQDYSSKTYQGMSPYVKLAFSIPIYDKDDQMRRLAVFKDGFTNNKEQWKKFKGSCLIYYIAWCFEYGQVEEGSKYLLQFFNQPAVLQNLWRNGTCFTDRYENNAYRRIRNLSRAIINSNLKQHPDNQYIQQLSQVLNMYEQKNP